MIIPLTLESEAHNNVFRDAVMLRTYCREVESVKEPGKWEKETANDVFLRVIDAFTDYYSKYYAEIPWFQERRGWISDWYNRMRTGKALPAGRMLWSMGTRAVEDEGFLPLMNCGFVVLDHPVEPFRFITNMLMLGCGMGFSVEKKYFDKLEQEFYNLRYPLTSLRGIISRDDSNPDSFPVSDCREGWIEFITHVITCAIKMRPCYFSLAEIRPAGSRIKGFGGRSGDPLILERTAKHIYHRIANEPNPSVSMFYDVTCLLASLIVSGNVRRSALMCIGDPDSAEFLSLKSFENLKIAPWRCNCNNSVNASGFHQLNEAFWNTYKGGSEPYGFVNVEKAAHSERKYKRYPPKGFNPCGEQPLANYEVCCLSEVNLPMATSPEDLFESIRMCYYFCKFVYFLECHEPKTREVTRANRRIGISLTGLAMVSEDIRVWAFDALKKLRDLDTQVSERLGIPTSVALTTVKPGGTLPKIAGSSGPGIHRPISRFQIRRVRFNKNSRLLKWFRDLGLPVEPQKLFNGEDDPSGTQVVSFYLKNQIPADGFFSDWLLTEDGFLDMINLVSQVQQHWSENAVSVTVYYPPEQVDSLVKPTIAAYFKTLKSLSCLPYYGHNFPQAPEEPISEKDYWNFIQSHPIMARYEVPHECDDVEDQELEDFGLCETKNQCSERG